MNLSFYTIDDLHLGPNLWTETRFDAVQDVLTHYRNLPGDTVKELGLMNGARKLPLIRRVGLSPGGQDLEDVLVTDCLAQPPLAGGLGGAGGGTEMCLRPEGSLLPGP